jgi:Flp pilus assembly pilin Flp
MKDLVARLWAEENGQDLTEYALLLVLLALGAIATVRALATTVNNVFQNSASNIATCRARQGIVIVLRFGLGRRQDCLCY